MFTHAGRQASGGVLNGLHRILYQLKFLSRQMFTSWHAGKAFLGGWQAVHSVHLPGVTIVVIRSFAMTGIALGSSSSSINELHATSMEPGTWGCQRNTLQLDYGAWMRS